MTLSKHISYVAFEGIKSSTAFQLRFQKPAIFHENKQVAQKGLPEDPGFMSGFIIAISQKGSPS